MRIGIDISRIARATRTGTEQYTYEVLAALARCDRRHDYLLYCNALPAQLPPLRSNFRLRRIPFPSLWTHARLSAEILADPPAVLFVPAHVLPLAAPLARRTRMVVTLHDLGYLHFPEAHTRAQRLLLHLTTAWSVRVADRVIAISAATRDDLTTVYGVPAGRITVIHHGVSDRFRDAYRPVQDMARDRPYFLYVGTLQPRKNLIRLCDAFSASESLRARGFRLLIAGAPGWLSGPIERRIAELNEAEPAGRIELLGYVPDERLPDLYAGATAFVFPSLYEGFGMPVLEAMAAGVPVVTSTTSALPEVAGDAALLVDPTDRDALTAALERLAADPDLRVDLRERGVARAMQFNWDTCARRTLEVLLGGRPE